MASISYDRYDKFRSGDDVSIVPFIPIEKRDTDQYIQYKRNFSRLDLLSHKYYGDASYGWLILQANPEVATCEFMIPNNSVLRIPYPLQDVLHQYENDIDYYIKLYGLEE